MRKLNKSEELTEQRSFEMQEKRIEEIAEWIPEIGEFGVQLFKWADFYGIEYSRVRVASLRGDITRHEIGNKKSKYRLYIVLDEKTKNFVPESLKPKEREPYRYAFGHKGEDAWLYRNTDAIGVECQQSSWRSDRLQNV